MKMRSFYKVYRKKPDTYKLFLLVQNAENMIRNRHDAIEQRCKGNKESAAYYESEARAMEERCRWLYSELWDVLEKKGEHHEC